MKVYYQIKRKLKLLRLKFRRLQAARRWGKDALAQAPPVLGFAIPKAGSHFSSDNPNLIRVNQDWPIC